MNKIEMLEILENIKTKIQQDNLDNYNLDNRVEEIEKIKVELAKIDDRITYLSAFANDENNYRNNYFALNDEALRYDLKKSVINSKLEVDNNKNKIDELNEDIAKANASIGSSNLEINTLQEELLINGQLLRELDADDIEQQNIINEDLKVARDRIDFLNTNIERLQNSIKSNNELLKSENDKTNLLNENLEKANDELNKFDNNIVNTPMINTAKQKADLEELKTLNYEKNELENRDRILSLDYSMEFQKIHDDLENDKINVDQASKAVESIIKTIPEGYFIEDIEAKEEELKANKKMQLETQNRIDRLQAKLEDDSKYTVSAFVAERNNSVIKSWETKLSQYEVEKENLNKQELLLNSDLVEFEAMLQECNTSIMQKGEELRSFGNDITKDEEYSVQESLNNLRREKQELQTEINNTRSNIINNSNEMTKVNEKYSRTEKTLNNLKSTLNDRNTIDRSEKRLDEAKLAAAVSTLSSLKNREKFISETVLEVVDKAVGVEDNTKEEDIPFPNEMKVDDKETTIYMDEERKSDIDAINEHLKELNIPAKVDLETPIVSSEEPKEVKFSPVPDEDLMDEKATTIYMDQDSKSLDDSINDTFKEMGIPARVDTTSPVSFEEQVEVPTVEEEKEPEKKRFACKFKEASKDLISKAKSKEFKEKLFKFAKKAAALVAILVVTSGGIKYCKSLMDKLNDPSSLDDTTIEQFIDDEINKTEPNVSDEVEVHEEESVVEEEKESVEEEKEQEMIKKPIYESQTNNQVEEEKEETNNNYNYVPNEDESHDNSDDITVPNVEEESKDETIIPEEDLTVEAPDALVEDNVEEESKDEMTEAPDADITETPEEDLNEVPDTDVTVTPEEDLNDVPETDVTVTPEEDLNDVPETDVTVTPDDTVNEDIVIEDAEVSSDVEEKDDEVVFDNSDDIEVPEEEVKEDDEIIIEDAEITTEETPEEEVVFDNLEETTPEENLDKEDQADVDINIEDIMPDINYEENSEVTFDNKTVELLPGENLTVETNSGDVVEQSNISDEKDEITFENDEIEREHELTKEELQQLREEFANSTSIESVNDDNSKNR